MHKATFAQAAIKRDIYHSRLPASVVHRMQCRHLLKIQNRIVNQQSVTLLLSGLKQVAFGTDIALEGHHDLFANRIDRRVGHLGKQLRKVIVEQARFVAKTSQRRVVTHRSDRVLLDLNQWQQHEVHRFGAVAKGTHPRDSFIPSVCLVDGARLQVIERDSLIGQP